jgi:hypothetical protein
MNTSRTLIALMVGVAGAVLLISGVRDVHPAVTFQQLLRTGTLPKTGAKTVDVTGGKPRPPAQYSAPIGPGLPSSPGYVNPYQSGH